MIQKAPSSPHSINWLGLPVIATVAQYLCRVKTPLQAPNANTHAERWVRSCRRECLNHPVLFGLSRLQRVLDQYRQFFNEDRPHQGIGNVVPSEIGQTPGDAARVSAGNVRSLHGVQCEEFLGGLLRSYSGKAA